MIMEMSSRRVWRLALALLLVLICHCHRARSSYAGSASAIIDPSRVKQVSWKPRSLSLSVSALNAYDCDYDYDIELNWDQWMNELNANTGIGNWNAGHSCMKVSWRSWNATTWFPLPNRTSRDLLSPMTSPERASSVKSGLALACSFPRTRLWAFLYVMV